MSDQPRFIRKGGKIIPIGARPYDGKSGNYRTTYTTNRGSQATKKAAKILKKGGKLAV